MKVLDVYIQEMLRHGDDLVVFVDYLQLRSILLTRFSQLS